MSAPTEQQVLHALATIIDPDLGRDVVSLGMIKELEIDGRDVSFTFELTTPACPVRDRFKSMAEEAVAGLPDVGGVRVKMTANVRSGGPRERQEMLPGVRQTIAVASGKGGVGKSTVAVNLAASLHLSGARVGLLDADIYGPSVPAMTGMDEQPPVVDVPGPDGKVERKLRPVLAYGLKVMSMGLLAGADKAMVWRGPMVSRAIEQFMSDVDWGELDYLVIDLPPGTGDASLTVAQKIPLSGVAIVATPQDVALDIAIKALQMFRTLNVTPLGLVENMSWYICPECGHEHHPFGHGGAERAAQRMGVPFLGSIPLEQGIREEADRGAPIVVSQPDSPGARAFGDVASQIAARTSVQSFRRLPVINVR
ncbi:MAG: Mrp/NBP35 family ATP-binding protein [Actinomycetota bacterium]|nr:Mrp/NBP35 family ATP-binding protein [Candidatus Dormibacteraeota bacterium]MDQ6915013.1 Mrp/NBP35 family ATP-binding protein [Actinomycetota bacterium]